MDKIIQLAGIGLFFAQLEQFGGYFKQEICLVVDMNKHQF